MADLLRGVTMTERGDFKFTVKESSDGTPWIAAEPSEKLLAAIPGQLGFELKAGTSYEEAKSVAAFLNTHVAAITHTTI
jgi:hypothetical protein